MNSCSILKTLSLKAIIVGSLLGLPLSGSAEIVLFDTNAKPLIVTAVKATPVATYAANEMVHFMELATGQKVEIVPEDAVPAGYSCYIYLGITEAAAKLKVDVEKLPDEACVIRSLNNHLYIIGAESSADPLDSWNSKCGVLFGVYEILERVFKVRWLWPGEDGIAIQKMQHAVLPDLDEVLKPRLMYREILWGYVKANAFKKEQTLSLEERTVGFSEAGLREYGKNLQVFLRRHRMGGMNHRPRFGHHFTNWCNEYGAEHPEWFMMHENGERGAGSKDRQGARNIPMCVSNQELRQFIVDKWNGTDAIQLGEVDWPDMCRCPECRALDMPPPDPLPAFLVSQTDTGQPGSKERQVSRGHVLAGFYKPLCTSDRYADFWLDIQQRAAKRNPEALITTYIYYSYFPTPTSGIKLNRHIFGEFVPWGNPQHTDFFPMSAAGLQWIKDQWDGWQKTGLSMGYRPNYMHDGWIMPLVDTAQSLDFFKHAVANGMVGTCYDSLTGQWSTQGPKLYGHLRLFAKPDLTIEEVLSEYYAAFGAAEPFVRDYFAYWENYCRANYQKFNDLFIDYGHRWSRFQILAHVAFPPASFPPSEALLHKAMQAAKQANQPEAMQRVQFLLDGLTHAKLGVKLAAIYNCNRNLAAGSPEFDHAIEALRNLILFRRTHEKPHIADYLYGGSWREQRFWNLKALLADQRLKDLVESSEGLKSHEPTNLP